MYFEHKPTLNSRSTMDLGINVEPLHPFEVLRLGLVEMGKGPTKAPDRLFLIDGLHCRQEALDTPAQLCVHIEMKTVLSQS